MYFVIFTFGLSSLVSATVNWWEFNVAKKAGWYLFMSITPTHIYYQLLALCVAIVGLWIMRDRSRMGFALTTLGADETVARQIGINTVALKIGTFIVSAVVMTLAGAILAPRRSYMDATVAFNPETSFLTVIMALLGGATSVWGPMLGVVPLLLIKDYLSIAFPSYFSVVLGLVLLGIVFFIPNGLIGLLRSGKVAIRTHSLADLLEAWARRLRGGRHVASPASATHPPANGPGRPPHDPSTAPGRLEREAQS
jgi:branched-chain amino acid transport system permease protein